MDVYFGGTATASAQARIQANGQIFVTPTSALDTAIDLTDSELTNAISLADNNITGTTYSILATSGNLTLDASAILALDGATSITFTDGGTLYSTFTAVNTDDFNIDAAGGDIVFNNDDVLNIGGSGDDVTFNAIGDDTANANGALVNSDNDLYIEGNLEVDGAIYQANNQVCDSSGNCLGGSGGSKWVINSGAISPFSTTLDVLIGGTATNSAKFAFMNVIGSNTPTASVSAGAAGATYLTSTGTLASTAMQPMTIGTSDSGNITLNSGTGRIILSDNDLINIGGISASTNAISDSGATINFAANDDDLYIEDVLEVDGTIYQAGNQVCDSSGNCVGGAGGSKWTLNSTLIHPFNTTLDVVVGGTATSSAKFQAYGIETTGGNVASLTSNTITTGSVFSATASAITSGNILKLGQGGNSAFSGNVIYADIDNRGAGDNGFTGDFLQFDDATITVFDVNYLGAIRASDLTLGLADTSATITTAD
ncbi:MAG: hypothetical protein UU80_C0049G0001, partial [candidate division WWE3 bacterium GW2011_GWA1_41_8]